MISTDVIIVGKGIAGLVLSSLLTQKGISNVVLHRQGRESDFALAETLPPSALPLLQKLGLLPLFENTALQKTYGYHSVWGRPAVVDNNFFSHRPYQYGLKINKQAIIHELESQQKGYIIDFGKELTIQQKEGGIEVVTENSGEPITINGKLIVDATGRKRAVLSKMGVAAEEHDSLIAFSCHVPFVKHPKLVHTVFIETFREGWGIVSRLDDARNVMTLFTRADSTVQGQLKYYEQWYEVLEDTLYLKDFLVPATDIKVKGSKANSSKAQTISGKNWLAVGDAAISFDPLSSHGITNAMFTVERATEAIVQHIRHDNEAALKEYEHTLAQIFQHYLKTKDHLYNMERRWPEASFWNIS